MPRINQLFSNFMAVLGPKDRCIGWEIRKKLGRQQTYGYCGYGEFLYGHGYPTHGIYQVRHRYGRIVGVRMKFYGPPETALRIANPFRAKFQDAMWAWRDLTADQKKVYTQKAKRLKMFGHNVFIREYFKTH